MIIPMPLLMADAAPPASDFPAWANWLRSFTMENDLSQFFPRAWLRPGVNDLSQSGSAKKPWISQFSYNCSDHSWAIACKGAPRLTLQLSLLAPAG